MSDERDPRLLDSGIGAEEESTRDGHRAITSRTVSGRFPVISTGRNLSGSRFSQTGMPAVPRTGNVGSSASMPPVPTAHPTAVTPPVLNVGGRNARSGRPGIVNTRQTRPVIHVQDASHELVHVEQETQGAENGALQQPSAQQQSAIQNEADSVVQNLGVAENMQCGGESSENVNVSSVSSDVELESEMGKAQSEAVEAQSSETVDADLSMNEEVRESETKDNLSGEASENLYQGDASGVEFGRGDGTVNASSDESCVEMEPDESDLLLMDVPVRAESDNSEGIKEDPEVSSESESLENVSDFVENVETSVDKELSGEKDSEKLSLAEGTDPDMKRNLEADGNFGDALDDETHDNGPAFEIKPIPPELRQEASLRDNAAYRKESRSLLRTQSWLDLIVLMQNVLLYAEWANMPEVRSSILRELAGIYQEKLNNLDKARETYRQLLRESPSNESALAFMEEEYRKLGDYKAIHRMYSRVVDAVWDSDERICYTRKAAEIAEQSLNSPALAIRDWEHLWQIGETGDEVQNALMSVYREHEEWEKLASFIRERCVDWKVMKRLGLREVVEIYISGLGDAQKADEVLKGLLQDRPNDPLLLLQNINICRINGDIDQLAQISRISNLEGNVGLDIHRVAAEVLWDKGERELAVQAYDEILAAVPDDRDALHAKEKYYSEGGYSELLCNFYEERAQNAIEHENQQEGIDFYQKAANVAEKQLFDNERAIAILKKIVELDASDVDIHKRIIALYTAIGDDNGVAASMEALLALTSRPALRRELLAQLGSFYLDKLDDYDRAESCWKKVQAMDPRNPEVSEELSRVYAKKGDFESLDKSLTQQIRVADADNIQQLAEHKGHYLMQHSPASAHTAAAWEIVLDCDPDHSEALENLSQVLDKLGRNEEMIGALEQKLSLVHQNAERISIGMRIADAKVDCATHAQAIAAYLRVLCWDPTNDSAQMSLESICNESEYGIIVSILEVAATCCNAPEMRCELLRRSLRFMPKENVLRRIQTMRRIMILGDRSIEPEFVELCRREHHSEILCATWFRRACETSDAEERARLLIDIARIACDDLNLPSMAFTTLYAAALDRGKVAQLAVDLEGLADKTNRWEEVVAVLGCLTSACFDENQRKMAMQKRIDIMLNHLQAPARALEEYGRLLSMDCENEELLSKIEQLAHENNLQDALLGIYGELWDATSSVTMRAEISQKRYGIYRNHLHQEEAALNELFIGYRLMPTSDLESSIMAQTQDSAKAALCVTLLESEKLSADGLQIEAIKTIAQIYNTAMADSDSAFALYSTVLANAPGDSEVLDKIDAMAENQAHSGRYAQALRLAASRAHKNGDTDLSLELYRKLAQFYKNDLHDLERSVDVERTILFIKPDCIPSLEAMIAWHQERHEWADLRSELIQRIAAGGSDEERIVLWMRVVEISSDYLHDVEGTFDGYAEILQIDENNQAAHGGIEQLTNVDIGPEVELRRLRLELKLAGNDKRADIMLKIADLQAHDLSLPDMACVTLETLYKETGPLGLGYMPLSNAYRNAKSWGSLVSIMLEHADAANEQHDVREAIATLSQALKIVDSKMKDEVLSAEIVAKLQAIDPDNEEIAERYLSSLRNTQDWNKYAKVLQSMVQASNIHIGRKNLLFELARVQSLALHQDDDACSIYREINSSGSVEKNAYFGVATMSLKKGDIDGYLNALEQVLRMLDPVWGAIFYCHMAEVCDEKNKPAQVATYYRNARALDPENAIASDSLRSIGRRLKNWRSTSAILPVENERELSWHERSNKLLELAKSAKTQEDARLWLWKAIAVDHDNAQAWIELSHLEQQAGNPKRWYDASFGAYGAIERTTLPGPADAVKNAQLLYDVSQAAIACGNHEKGEILLRKAYALTRACVPVDLAIGEIEQDSGNMDKAYAIYDGILNNSEIEISNDSKGEALFKRGLIAHILQNYNQALDDLRQTVKMSPLHYDALMTISKTYADMNQPLLALAAMQQALIVTPNKTKRRGSLYYDMGKIWSDAFNDHDEAGIYYEGALDNGASNVDLIERCLEIYKRAGRYHEALELADTLTKTTTNPAILASLWCTRGELSESISPEQATEAYDMALSYVPGIARAFEGLERMLTARGEWEQLADLLNGRLESGLPKDQEASILLRLADIYATHLNQSEKASNILYRLLDEQPNADVVQRLLAVPQNDDEKCAKLYEKAIIYCHGAYNYALELAQQHLKAGHELQAWAIMSPLRTLLQLDAQTKETLNDLKAKFEKTDAVPINTLAKALPPFSDEQFAILNALKVVENAVGTLGAKKIDDIASNVAEVSENTPNGKIFAQMREGLEIGNVSLYRSAELPEAITVLLSDPVAICIRTEIFQKAAGNELQFWLAKGAALAHPDVRFLAATPLEIRQQLPEAVLALAGISEPNKMTADIVAKLKKALSENDIKEIGDQLTLYSKDALIACAKTFTHDLLESCDIVAAYAVADMRTVWRAQSRIDASIIEQRNVKTVDEISKAIESSDTLRDVLAYYVSSTFTENLEGA